MEDQASDRARRLGQKRPVTIYRFIAEGTVEENIAAMHTENFYELGFATFQQNLPPSQLDLGEFSQGHIPGRLYERLKEWYLIA